MKKPLSLSFQEDFLQINKLREKLREAGQPVGVVPLDADPSKGPRRASTASLRASRKRRSETGEITASLLLDADGVLRWQFGSMAAPETGPLAPGARRRRGSRRRGVGPDGRDPLAGDVVDQMAVEPLGISDVNSFLRSWDTSFGPNPGLREWKNGNLIPVQPNGKKPARTLLIVHGTASNSENMVKSLDKTEDPADQKTFLAWAAQRYDRVLTFDHPTLSVSPIINALVLERELEQWPGVIDIVCHSRGGLVSRWWYEVACKDPQRRGKIVFACSPHFGTSLADPSKARKSLDYLTNVGNVVGNVLGVASGLFPFLSIVQGLVRLVGVFTSAMAKLPIVDMAIGMVPGLAAQSRIADHAEMLELQSRFVGIKDYYAISAHFQPKDFSIWTFWQSFTFEKLVGFPLAEMLFPGHHDLVVDTSSMTMLNKELAISAKQKDRVLAFGEKDHINHATCFDDARAVRFLKMALN